MLAITVARRLPRKAKITSTTSTTASISSISTCCTEARIPAVRSESTWIFTALGRPACRIGSCFLIASTVAMTLAPGWRCMFMMIAGTSWRDGEPKHVSADAGADAAQSLPA